MSACLWIVVVNYRTPELAVDCLRSLSSQVDALGNGRVVVVDNKSGDDSVEKLSASIDSENWGAWAEVKPMDRNGGFAYGNNAGIRLALAAPKRGDYVLLLNPDTIVHPGAIKALVAFMDANPEVGIAGSRLENAAGGIDCSAHRAPSPLGELNGSARLGLISRLLHRYVVSPPVRSEAHECDWVSGASMIIRRDVIEEIGPMDEGYFLYFEEVDFCCRARTAGWPVWYVPESRVMHLEGAATGIRAAAKRRPMYWYDSRRRFFIKHYGVGGLVLADLLWAFGRLSFLLRRALRLGARGKASDPKRFMFDLLWSDLRALICRQAEETRPAGGRP